MIRSRRRHAFAFTCALALPLAALACKKDPPVEATPIVPPPPPVVELDAGTLELTPLVEDAGVDAEVDAGKKPTGTATSVNQSRAKQCCNAIAAQAKAAGGAPELMMIATTCNAIAAQLGPTSGGKAPEFEPIRQMLKGKTLPPVCQGL